ncbi:MAG: recombinase family protein [Actinomycetota bacterium]|nr:recombinase family protein [Actinomycetota bacterium]
MHTVGSAPRHRRPANQGGSRTPTGGPWSAHTIRWLLTNPAYLGQVTFRDMTVHNARRCPAEPGLSAISGSETLVGLVMTCASTWLEAALADASGGQRLVVLRRGLAPARPTGPPGPDAGPVEAVPGLGARNKENLAAP